MRPHVRVHRRRCRGSAWYVLEGRLSGESHRLSAATHAVVGRTDGRRRAVAIRAKAVEALGHDAPSQDDVVGLLGQLHAADLLRSHASPAAP